MTDTEKNLSESDELAREETRERRVRRFKRGAAALIALFVVFLLLLLENIAYDYAYVCRIPPGTTVVDWYLIWTRLHAPCFDYFFREPKYEKLRPYLMYRHFIIPDGATEIGERAFSNGGCRDVLQSVRIPGSVKKIGPFAFAGCTRLTKITIPDGVETIDYRAFENCTELRHVELPGSLRTLAGTFHGCTALEKIRIPDGVKKIDVETFSGCTALCDVDISDTVEGFGQKAFENCTALKEIRLPAYSHLAPDLFAGCVNLKKVAIPEGVRTISPGAFMNCSSLSEINIPDSVKMIHTQAFLGCRSLPPITIGKQITGIAGGAFTGTGGRLIVPDDHPYYRLKDGLLYRKEGALAVISCVSEPDGPCVIDPESKSIMEYAFSGCTGLKQVVIPPDMMEIGYRAFAGCTGLTEISIPSSVVSIHQSAFAGCTALKDVELLFDWAVAPDVFEGTPYQQTAEKERNTQP